MQNSQGTVLALYISTKKEPNRENRVELHLDENGVKNDKFYAKDIGRSVLLASKMSYDLAKSEDIDINYGDLGENILLDYNPYELAIGTKIKIGNVILEISQNSTLCKGLSKVNSRLPKLLKTDRGIFAKVVTSGIIKNRDRISILKN